MSWKGNWGPRAAQRIGLGCKGAVHGGELAVQSWRRQSGSSEPINKTDLAAAKRTGSTEVATANWQERMQKRLLRQSGQACGCAEAQGRQR